MYNESTAAAASTAARVSSIPRSILFSMWILHTWTKHIPPVGNRDEMKVHNINKLRECIRDVVKLLSLDNHFVVCFSVIYATMLFILTTGWVVVFICERMCRAAVSLSYVYTLYSKPIYWDNWIIRWISHWFLSKLLSHVGIWRDSDDMKFNNKMFI